MIRTQIYIPEDQHELLMTVAKKKKQPMAEIVRGLIAKGLHEEGTIDRSGKEVLRKLIAIAAKGGPPDLSTNHDHYLYGGPKKE